ncbi:MAG: O-antigen ligase family protein [Bacteroidales bacterium]|nr:O-antigen ligase family protein [Bacteroidales bacterium]
MNGKSLHLVDWFVGAMFLWVAARSCVNSPYPCGQSMLWLTICLGIYLMARCAISLARIGRQAALWIIVAAGSFEAVLALCQLAGFVRSGHPGYLMTGTFLNPGPLGGFLAVSAAAAAASYAQRQSNLMLGAMGLIMVALAGTWSRSAWIALCIGLLPLACAWYVKKIRPFSAWWIDIGIPICIIVLMICLMRIAIYMKYESAMGRWSMAQIAYKAWTVHPIAGWGGGSMLHAMSEVQREYYALHPQSWMVYLGGVADYPFCEPLRIAVDYGAIGLALFIGLIASALRNLWRGCRGGFCALLTLATFSIGSYPLSLWPFCILGSILLAIAADCQPSRESVGLRVALGSMGVVVTVCAALAMQPYLRAERQYQRFQGMAHPSLLKSYAEIEPWMRADKQFLFDYGKALRDAGRLNESNHLLRQAVMVCNDPMPRVLIGRNYEDMGATDRALDFYRQAHEMLPNRFYPTYRRMKLYEALGDTPNAKRAAHDMLAIHPKVVSQATQDMYREAVNVIVDLEFLKRMGPTDMNKPLR